MAKKLLALGFSLFAAAVASAQTPTVVTGTVKDTNGVAYSFAKVSAQLIPTTASPTVIVNGIPTAIGGQQNANADVNGTFSMNLFCNTSSGGCSVISPSGTQWQITVNVNGAPPPLGTGPQACSATLTITGASQSVSSSFSACPAVSASGVGGGGSTQVNPTCASSMTFTIAPTFITDFFVNLNCNVTSSTMAGPFVAGTEAVFTLTQDNTGGRTFAWPTGFLNTPLLGTAAGASTVVTFQYCGPVGSGNACPANSWQNTDVGPVGSGTGIGPVFNVKNSPYGALGTAQCVTDAVTNNTTTITSASAHFQTGAIPAQVGWLVWAYSPGGATPPCNDFSSGGLAGTLRCGSATAGTVSTIASINSDSSITITPSACTGSNSGLTLVYGPNDFTAISAACTAVPTNGGIVYLPRSFYVVDNSAAGGNNPTCSLPSTIIGSATVLGDGESQTVILPAPWYRHTFNFGSVIANYASRSFLRDFTIDMGGIAQAPGANTIVDVYNPAVERISVLGANQTSGTNESIYAASGTGNLDNYISNSTFTAVNSAGIAVSGPYSITLHNNYVTSQKNAFETSSNAGNSSTFISGGFYYGTASGSNAITFNQGGGTPHGMRLAITGATICANASTAILVDQTTADAIVTIDGARINDQQGTGSTGSCASLINAPATGISNTGGTVHISKSIVQGFGAGNTVSNTSNFFDDGGNTFVGGAGFTGAGQWSMSCNSFPVPLTAGLTGFGTSPSVTSGGNACTFRVNVGTGGVATTGTITFPTAAPNGWNCTITDFTTNAKTTFQSGVSTTTCGLTATAAWVASDILLVQAAPY